MVYNGVLRLLVRAHTYPSQGAIDGGGGGGGVCGGGQRREMKEGGKGRFTKFHVHV